MNQTADIKCEKCNNVIAVRYLEAGDKIKCLHCGHFMTIPPEFKPAMKDIEPDYSSPGSWKPPAYKENKHQNSEQNKSLSKEEKQLICDRYIPKSFALITYYFVVTYLYYRQQTGAFPIFMNDFITSYVFEFYIYGLFGIISFIGAIIIFFIAALEISEKWWQAFFLIDEDIIFKIKYLKPLIILFAVIIIIEGMIFIYKAVS